MGEQADIARTDSGDLIVAIDQRVLFAPDRNGTGDSRYETVDTLHDGARRRPGDVWVASPEGVNEGTTRARPAATRHKPPRSCSP